MVEMIYYVSEGYAVFVVLIFWAFYTCVVRVIVAAVNREELVVHTLEDFHVPSFEFGDRSPFGKYIYILCTRSIGQERKLCADLHSRVFFSPLAFHLRPCKGMLSF